MQLIGYDKSNKPIKLPQSVDEYYGYAAKYFSDIRKIIFSKFGEIKIEGEVIKGDFALLRAFLADNDRDIYVSVISENDRIDMYFAAYSYDFIEDTFARAIHHKIEGSGYALRECVGKYELRIREYDRLFSRVKDYDMTAALNMATARLLYPVNLTDMCKRNYEKYLNDNDEAALHAILKSGFEKETAISYMTEHSLLSAVSARRVALEDGVEAEYCTRLLNYVDGSSQTQGGRLSL